jgi:hypothetical protein
MVNVKGSIALAIRKKPDQRRTTITKDYVKIKAYHVTEGNLEKVKETLNSQFNCNLESVSLEPKNYLLRIGKSNFYVVSNRERATDFITSITDQSDTISYASLFPELNQLFKKIPLNQEESDSALINSLNTLSFGNWVGNTAIELANKMDFRALPFIFNKIKSKKNDNNPYGCIQFKEALSIFFHFDPKKFKSDLVCFMSKITNQAELINLISFLPFTESELVTHLTSEIKKQETEGSDRQEMATILVRLGYLVLGNLNPKEKEFKPEKIVVVNFNDNVKQQHLSYRNANGSNAFGQCHLIVNLGFYISFNIDGEINKQRTYISLPIKIPDTKSYSIDSLDKSSLNDLDPQTKHSEIAFYDQLFGNPAILDELMQKIPEAIAQKIGTYPKAIINIKINGVIFEFFSKYQSCDTCHSFGSQKLWTAFTDKLKHTSLVLPKKSPVATGALFNFLFSCNISNLGNTFLTPLTVLGQTSSKNFFTNCFIQRQCPDAVSDVCIYPLGSSDNQHTLFISNGSKK